MNKKYVISTAPSRSAKNSKQLKDELYKEQDLALAKKNSYLSCLMLGLILLVLAAFFLYLSFKKDVVGNKRFVVGSFEFIIFCPTIVASVSFLITGIVSLFKNHKRKVEIKQLTAELKK